MLAVLERTWGDHMMQVFSVTNPSDTTTIACFGSDTTRLKSRLSWGYSLLLNGALVLGFFGGGMEFSQAQVAKPVSPGIESVNIADVPKNSNPAQSSKTGVTLEDASDQSDYSNQTNAQRMAVQPGNNAPHWRAVNSGQNAYSSLPKDTAPEAGVLIQGFVEYPGMRATNAGEAWRQVRNRWLIPYGGSLILIALGAIALFYKTKGPLRLEGQDTGRKIERFTPFERSAHWANAIAFCILAVSGLVMSFGKFLLEPWLGKSLFGWLTYLLKTAHNFAGPLFAVSLVVVFVTFLKDNWPAKEDIVWIFKAGGMLNGEHVSSHRFNAGEKIVFWGGVFFLGLVVVGSGFFLDKLIPGWVYLRNDMQIAQMVHATATVLMMSMFLGHIYLGTVGMEGAYDAMRTGLVDENWALQHHDLWLKDIQDGLIPAFRSKEAGEDSKVHTPLQGSA